MQLTEAQQLRPGMKISHPGWIDAHDRSELHFQVVEVTSRTKVGGWKSQNFGMWPETFTLVVDIVSRDDPHRTRISCPGNEEFRVHG